MLADDVEPRRPDRLEHRRERGFDTRRLARLLAAWHDKGRGRVAWHRDRGQPNPLQLGTFGAVQHHVVTALIKPQGKVADECLGAAQLRPMKGRDRRGDDGDSHGRVLV